MPGVIGFEVHELGNDVLQVSSATQLDSWPSTEDGAVKCALLGDLARDALAGAGMECEGCAWEGVYHTMGDGGLCVVAWPKGE